MLKKSVIYFGPIFLMRLNNRSEIAAFSYTLKCPPYTYVRVLDKTMISRARSVWLYMIGVMGRALPSFWNMSILS